MTTPLFMQTFGTGSDIVLLHGWGMHSGVWEAVVESLMDHYRVTMLDLPGHGYSQWPETKLTLKDLAATVLTMIHTPATWIGWSLGGLVAQQVALSAPEQVKQLVLVGSTPCFVQRPDWAHGLALSVLHRFAEELRQDYRAVLKRFIALEVHGSAHASTQLKQLKAILFERGEPHIAALQEGLAILETSDLRSQWANIQCPTLLLMGQRDQLVPAAAGEAILALLPKARLQVFSRAGHAPFFSHLPEFVAALRAFLDAE